MLDSGRRSVFIFKFICFIFKLDCPGESKPVTNNSESFMVRIPWFSFSDFDSSSFNVYSSQQSRAVSP